MTKIERLHSLLEMNGDETIPKVNPIHIYTAIGFLEETKTEPYIYPTTSGGIVLEYEIGKNGLDVQFENDGISVLETRGLDIINCDKVTIQEAKAKALETLNWR